MGGRWREGQILEPAESHGPEGMSPWAESKGFLVPWKVGTTALGTVTPWWGPLRVGVGSDVELLKGDKAGSLRLAVSPPGVPLLRAPQAGDSGLKVRTWWGAQFIPDCSDLTWSKCCRPPPGAWGSGFQSLWEGPLFHPNPQVLGHKVLSAAAVLSVPSLDRAPAPAPLLPLLLVFSPSGSPYPSRSAASALPPFLSGACGTCAPCNRDHRRAPCVRPTRPVSLGGLQVHLGRPALCQKGQAESQLKGPGRPGPRAEPWAAGLFQVWAGGVPSTAVC